MPKVTTSIAIVCMLIFLFFVCTHNEQITLIADPLVLQIPIHENHDPLIDLKNQSIIAIGPSPEIPNNIDYTKMRKTVYEKLVQAQKTLPHGFKFCIYEAYRSIPLQEKLFTMHYNDLKTSYHLMKPETLFNETMKLVSPVINLDGSHNIPPHSTGAALDIYLIDAHGHYVDMGIHPENWSKDMDGSRSLINSQVISKAARQNRAIMSKALREAGFVNYPTEYWHWSYGDRYWAYVKKQPFALYDTVQSSNIKE